VASRILGDCGRISLTVDPLHPSSGLQPLSFSMAVVAVHSAPMALPWNFVAPKNATAGSIPSPSSVQSAALPSALFLESSAGRNHLVEPFPPPNTGSPVVPLHIAPSPPLHIEVTYALFQRPKIIAHSNSPGTRRSRIAPHSNNLTLNMFPSPVSSLHFCHRFFSFREAPKLRPPPPSPPPPPCLSYTSMDKGSTVA